MRRCLIAAHLLNFSAVLALSSGCLSAQGLNPNRPPLSVQILDEKAWYQKPENWIASSAVLIALAAFAVAAWQTVLQRRSVQLSAFESVFQDIRQADKEFKEQYELPLSKEIEFSQPGSSAEADSIAAGYSLQLDVTAHVFFNSVEYFAFLVNHKFIRDRVLVHYFDAVLPSWHERLNRCSRELGAKQSPTFVEFKHLCAARGIPPA